MKNNKKMIQIKYFKIKIHNKENINKIITARSIKNKKIYNYMVWINQISLG